MFNIIIVDYLWWNSIMESFECAKTSFCTFVAHTLKRGDTMLRKSVEQRVAVTLWCLAPPTEYQTITHLFSIARSIVCKTVLMKDYIKFPYASRNDFVVDVFKMLWCS